MKMDNNQNQNFFIKLLSGNLGLAKTYWIYGVAVSYVSFAIFVSIESEYLKGVALAIYVTYMVFLLVGFFNAITKHKGLLIWRVLSMVILIMWIWNIFILSMTAHSIMNQ